MAALPYDCEIVLCLEEIGAGAEDILQYARAVLPQREIRSLVRGLNEILDAAPTPPLAAAENELLETAVSAAKGGV